MLSANRGVFFAKANMDDVRALSATPAIFLWTLRAPTELWRGAEGGSDESGGLTCDDIPAARPLRPQLSRKRYGR